MENNFYNSFKKIIREKNILGKIVNELDIAIKKDYECKFWIGCKG